MIRRQAQNNKLLRHLHFLVALAGGFGGPLLVADGGAAGGFALAAMGAFGGSFLGEVVGLFIPFCDNRRIFSAREDPDAAGSPVLVTAEGAAGGFFLATFGAGGGAALRVALAGGFGGPKDAVMKYKKLLVNYASRQT